MIARNEIEKGPMSNLSLMHVFQERVASSSGAVAAKYKSGGSWHDVTWSTMATRATRLAHALVSAGIQKGDRICLMGDTHVDWVVCDLGIQLAGAVSVPIYQSNLADECQYIAENCGARLVLVDSAKQSAKFVEVKARLPQVSAVIQYGGDVANAGWVRPLEAFLSEGDAHAKANPGAVDARWRALTSEDLSTIIYTSGTTGRPKGVMLAHDAFVFEAEAINQIGVVFPDDVELIFLPLAHVFAQVLKGIWFKLGHVMAFAESVEKVVDNMGEVKPTFMAAVPRVFEKAFNKVVTDGGSQPGLKGKLFRMTMTEFDKYAAEKDAGREYSSLPFTIGRKVVLPKVKDKLNARFGGRLRFFISGGAPLSRKIARFFETAARHPR